MSDNLLFWVRTHFRAVACARCKGLGFVQHSKGGFGPGETVDVWSDPCDRCLGEGAFIALREKPGPAPHETPEEKT